MLAPPPVRHRLHAFARLAGALTAVAIRGPLRRAVTLYLGMAIVASVIFAPNGLRASDVTSAAADFPPARPLLLGLWVFLTAGIARDLIEAPGTTVLRALPVPRGWFWTVQAAHLLLAELPWVMLWTRGAGALAGAAAAACAMGAHGLVVLSPRRVSDWAVSLALLGCLLAPLPAGALLALAMAAAAWAIPQAWQRSWEHHRHRFGRRVAGPAVLALALAYLARLRRRDPGLLFKACGQIAFGLIVIVLAVINNHITAVTTLTTLTLGVGGPLLLLAAGNIAAVILRAEAGDRWLMDALGVPRAVRGLGAIALVAALGAVWGAALATAGSLASGRAMVALAPVSAAAIGWGACLAVVALGCRRWVETGDGREGSRAHLVLVAVALPADLLVVFLGAPALAIVAAAALLAGLRYAALTDAPLPAAARAPEAP